MHPAHGAAPGSAPCAKDCRSSALLPHEADFTRSGGDFSSVQFLGTWFAAYKVTLGKCEQWLCENVDDYKSDYVSSGEFIIYGLVNWFKKGKITID